MGAPGDNWDFLFQNFEQKPNSPSAKSQLQTYRMVARSSRQPPPPHPQILLTLHHTASHPSIPMSPCPPVFPSLVLIWGVFLTSHGVVSHNPFSASERDGSTTSHSLPTGHIMVLCFSFPICKQGQQQPHTTNPGFSPLLPVPLALSFRAPSAQLTQLAGALPTHTQPPSPSTHPSHP